MNQDKELISIEGQAITRIEFRNQPVITFRMIDQLHERPETTARQTFNRNKERFIENEDFFYITYEERGKILPVCETYGQNDRSTQIFLTESGYLLLVKVFNDDRSWKVQRALIKSYFALKSADFGQNLSQIQQTLGKDRLVLPDKRELDGLVRREVRRIVTGDGTIDNIYGFDGGTMGIIEKDGGKFVAIQSVCEELDLDWESQRQLLEKDPVLNSKMATLSTTAKDGKQVEIVCLPIVHLNGWLFRIDASQYKGTRRAKLLRYQRECYQILFNHYFDEDIRFSNSLIEQHLTENRRILRKERLLMAEEQKLERLAMREARRIDAGETTIFDLSGTHRFMVAVFEALDKIAVKRLTPTSKKTRLKKELC